MALWSLQSSVAHLGRCRYLELAAFGALGARAGSCDRPSTALFVAQASRSAFWRATQLEDLFPVSVGLPSLGDLTVGSTELDDSLALAVSPGDDDELLEVLVDGLFAALIETYLARRDTVGTAADGPVVVVASRLVAELERLAGLAPIDRRPTSGARAKEVLTGLSRGLQAEAS